MLEWVSGVLRRIRVFFFLFVLIDLVCYICFRWYCDLVVVRRYGRVFFMWGCGLGFGPESNATFLVSVCCSDFLSRTCVPVLCVFLVIPGHVLVFY